MMQTQSHTTIARRPAMRYSILILCLICICCGSASGTVYVVLPDGNGDVPTIQAAVDTAVSGDIIELGDGIFTGPGNRDVVIEGKELVLRSQSGDPDACVIDCQASSDDRHRALEYETIFELYYGLVEGITFTNGYVYGTGGGVRTSTYAIISFTNCVFRNNVALSGGGLYCVASEGALRGSAGSASMGELYCPIVDCRFENNSASNGGAVQFMVGFPAFERCTFIGNSGGGFGSLYCGMTFHDCVFIDNTGSRAALESSVGFFIFEIVGCTFARNSPVAVFNDSVVDPLWMGNTFWNNAIAITTWFSSPFQMSNSIIVGSTVGIFGDRDNAILTCCDLIGNEGGDWVGGLEGQLGINGNISVDPAFCDPAGDDFTLAADSPCLPGNHPDGEDCGQIGAWGEGCGSTAVCPTTWGAIKDRFRK